MSTVLFHRMSVQIKERTEIRILHTTVKAFCHHCQKDVHPNVIISKFLSLPLSTCSICCSVIQYQDKK